MENTSTSALRADAARINGAKSKGPVTPEGKARSSLNAVKHGILSRAVVVQDESQSELDELLEELRTDRRPQGYVEEMLVEEIGLCQWRLRRVLAAERSAITNDPLGPLGMGTDGCIPSGTTLDNIIRYETSLKRQFYKALEQLERLQHKRGAISI